MDVSGIASAEEFGSPGVSSWAFGDIGSAERFGTPGVDYFRQEVSIFAPIYRSFAETVSVYLSVSATAKVPA